jgi:hypothetical protein
MQPEEQMTMSATFQRWLDAELFSLMQLFFFLTLGYVVTRTWIWSRACAAKVVPKKIEATDHAAEEKTAGCHEDVAVAMPQPKTTTRLSNAHERKRQKKEMEGVVNNVRIKSETKLLEQEVVLQSQTHVHCQEDSGDSPTKLDTAGNEQPSEMPDIEPTEEQPCQQSAVSERVAKLMAKKVERKARKALEKKMHEEKSYEEEREQKLEVPEPHVSGFADESPIAANVEEDSGVEATPCDAQITSTLSMSQITCGTFAEELQHTNSQSDNSEPRVSELHINEETEGEYTQVFENEAEDREKEQYIIDEEHSSHKFVSAVNSEAMEAHNGNSDEPDDFIGSVCSGICTPEERWTTSHVEMSTSPVAWSGMNPIEFDHSPMTADSQDFTAMLPQVEGWIPVILPAEQAPPGPFDGIWKNQAQERIEINHSDIVFESGEKWMLQMLSPTSLCVHFGDEEFQAELNPESLTLSWNDGDLWMRMDQTENQKQWAVASPQNADVPCLLWEGAQLTGEHFFEESTPVVNKIPDDAQEWEICWDWSKKGWCSRKDCEWYHPEQLASPDYCKPCDMDNNAFLDGPFADERQIASRRF